MHVPVFTFFVYIYTHSTFRPRTNPRNEQQVQQVLNTMMRQIQDRLNNAAGTLDKPQKARLCLIHLPPGLFLSPLVSIDGASGHSLTDSPTLLTHATTYTTHNPQVIGKQVEERPVWGIDAYTRRMLEIVLDSAPDPMAPEARTAFIEKARGGRFLLAGLGCLVWFGCVLGACIGTCRRTLTDAAIIGPPRRHDRFLSKAEAAARHQHAAQGQGPRHGAGPHRARGGAYLFLLYFLGGLGWLCAHTDVWLAYAHAYT